MEKIRRRYIFTGRVQGVGFRYRAYHAAGMYGVTGRVCNRYDGSVKMEAQGTADAIDMILSVLQNDRYIYIDGMTVENIPPEDESGFSIM